MSKVLRPMQLISFDSTKSNTRLIQDCKLRLKQHLG